MKEIVEGGKKELQEMINEILKRGYDCKTHTIMYSVVPDELKDKMKTGVIGKQLEIDQKMSLREK